MNEARDKGMTLIVKTVTRLTLGFILLYGIYIAMSGHESPGGGFAGGVIIALSLVHVMLAFGKEVALKRLHSYTVRIFVSLAALTFLYIAVVSFDGGCVPVKSFFGSIKPCEIFNNELTIPFCEMVLVGGVLYAIFIALVLLSKTDKDSE